MSCAVPVLAVRALLAHWNAPRADGDDADLAARCAQRYAEALLLPDDAQSYPQAFASEAALAPLLLHRLLQRYLADYCSEERWREDVYVRCVLSGAHDEARQRLLLAFRRLEPLQFRDAVVADALSSRERQWARRLVDADADAGRLQTLPLAVLALAHELHWTNTRTLFELWSVAYHARQFVRGLCPDLPHAEWVRAFNRRIAHELSQRPHFGAASVRGAGARLQELDALWTRSREPLERHALHAAELLVLWLLLGLSFYSLPALQEWALFRETCAPHVQHGLADTVRARLSKLDKSYFNLFQLRRRGALAGARRADSGADANAVNPTQKARKQVRF